MKALVKSHAKAGLWLQDVPEPSIGINDVLIRVLRTGICGTDVHIYNWNDWAQRTIQVPIGDRARVRRRDRLGRIQRQRFSSRRTRIGRRPRRLRPLSQLHGRPAASLRAHLRTWCQSRGMLCGIHRAADDESMASRSIQLRIEDRWVPSVSTNRSCGRGELTSRNETRFAALRISPRGLPNTLKVAFSMARSHASMNVDDRCFVICFSASASPCSSRLTFSI